MENKEWDRRLENNAKTIVSGTYEIVQITKDI